MNAKAKAALSWIGLIVFVFAAIFAVRHLNILKGIQDEIRLVEQQEEQQRIALEEKQRLAVIAQFNNAIEYKYRQTIKLYQNKRYDDAIELIEEFKNHERMDYKDITRIRIQSKIKSLEAEAKTTPAEYAGWNLTIYNQLLELDPGNKKYQRKVSHYSARHAEADRKKSCDLELLKWGWGVQHGWVIAQGQIKNISGRKLERVEALVTWYDENRNMITSDSALIKYDPIMPNQISPFKVMERHNPLMTNANIEFKFMWGNRISTYINK